MPILTSCRPESPQRLLDEEESEVGWNMSRMSRWLPRWLTAWKPARPLPPSLSSPITLPVPPPLRLLWPYWPQLSKLSTALLFSPPPPPSPSSACSTGKKGPFLASLPSCLLVKYMQCNAKLEHVKKIYNIFHFLFSTSLTIQVLVILALFPSTHSLKSLQCQQKAH